MLSVRASAGVFQKVRLDGSSPLEAAVQALLYRAAHAARDQAAATHTRSQYLETVFHKAPNDSKRPFRRSMISHYRGEVNPA